MLIRHVNPIYEYAATTRQLNPQKASQKTTEKMSGFRTSCSDILHVNILCRIEFRFHQNN